MHIVNCWDCWHANTPPVFACVGILLLCRKQIVAKIVKTRIYLTKIDSNTCDTCRLIGNSGSIVRVKNLSQLKTCPSLKLGITLRTLALLVFKIFWM